MGPVTNEGELAQRIARLGPPWGFNPGQRPLRPVEMAAERANAERLEGAPRIEPQLDQQLGLRAFDLVAGKALADAVEELLKKIFG